MIPTLTVALLLLLHLTDTPQGGQMAKKHLNFYLWKPAGLQQLSSSLFESGVEVCQAVEFRLSTPY